MANKALAKRQKMTLRIEPSRTGLKPRNPFATAAKQRAGGPHRQHVSAQRQEQQRMLGKLLGDSKKSEE